MELLLIRHGECVVNVAGVDEYDPPLTNLGWHQAHRVGQRLRRSPVSILYCGALLRNLQTAQCIHEEVGLRPYLHRGVYEIGYNFACRPWAVIRKEFPVVRLVEEIPDCRRDAQETFDEAVARADALLAWLREQHAHTDLCVGVVSHGTFNDLLLGRCLGLPPAQCPRFSSGNCSIHWLQVGPDLIRVRKLNDEGHIHESERS